MAISDLRCLKKGLFTEEWDDPKVAFSWCDTVIRIIDKDYVELATTILKSNFPHRYMEENDLLREVECYRGQEDLYLEDLPEESPLAKLSKAEQKTYLFRHFARSPMRIMHSEDWPKSQLRLLAAIDANAKYDQALCSLDRVRESLLEIAAFQRGETGLTNGESRKNVFITEYTRWLIKPPAANGKDSEAKTALPEKKGNANEASTHAPK